MLGTKERTRKIGIVSSRHAGSHSVHPAEHLSTKWSSMVPSSPMQDGQGTSVSYSTSTPEQTERAYKDYYNSVVSSGDWLVGVIGLPFALTSLIDLQTALQQSSGPLRLLLNFLYILAVAVGFGPTFYFPYHNKPFYIAWRAWFVANSVFWSLLRYAFTLYRYTVMASEGQITHTAFVLKALLFGPHVITLMLGIGYPLSIDIAFPFAAIFSIGTSACCGFIHSMVVQSPATQPHLEFLDRLLCSGFYGDFVLVTTGTPCSPKSVLLNLWCAESGVSLFLVAYFIMLEQSNRRKAFFQVSGLVEPYPVFFDGFFSHSTSIGAFVVLGLCLMYLLSSWDSYGLAID